MQSPKKELKLPIDKCLKFKTTVLYFLLACKAFYSSDDIQTEKLWKQ